MIIFPAIDIQNGKCVRLEKGDFQSAKIYAESPVKQAISFANDGAAWVHMVNLDGAESGTKKPLSFLDDILKNTPLKLQFGGGIRDEETAKALLENGVHRIVIGTLAIHKPEIIQRLVNQYGPDRITFALDVVPVASQYFVATHGWKNVTEENLFDAVERFLSLGANTFLITDVSKDGMLQGVNLDLYKTLSGQFTKANVIASGGVTELNDLAKLNNLDVFGVIVGRALYENKFSLQGALTVGGG